MLCSNNYSTRYFRWICCACLAVGHNGKRHNLEEDQAENNVGYVARARVFFVYRTAQLDRLERHLGPADERCGTPEQTDEKRDHNQGDSLLVFVGLPLGITLRPIVVDYHEHGHVHLCEA